MQTSFTTEQLRDPDTAESNKILRTCVHCGMCTATCPTFLELGDELDSPRGRIYLIKDMLEAGTPATEEVVRHIDRCLSCLSCMTTCPSGVHYMHLVDHARTYIQRTFRRPWHDRLLRAVLARVLPNPTLFRAALTAARAGKPIAGIIPSAHPLAGRLRAMLRLAPAKLPGTDAFIGIHKAQGTRRARVALLTGCAQVVLAPEINAATIRLLTRLGVEVVVPRNAGCCGALTHHMGYHDQAMASARTNLKAWGQEIDVGGLDAIVINASGCGTTVKDYGFMFRTEPEHAQAERISALTQDISEFLTRIGYQSTRPAPGLTVAYHSACSLQHGQRITTEPKALLSTAGFTVVEPHEPHICCGSTGTYNMLQPEIADRLRTRKLGNLEATNADLVAAGNIGCITQLSGAGLPVVHTVQLLDWMAGGPEPPVYRGIDPMRRTLLLLLCLATPALAQTAPPSGGNQPNQLLDALHVAPSPEIAAALETQLEEAWLNAGSPAVRLLMNRGLRELKASNYKDAVAAFGDVVTLDPNSAEGYRQLGLARYAAGDPRGAIESLAIAVQHEPRDFLAYKSLSEIAAQQQDWRGAYDAWQKVLALDPNTPDAQKRLKQLQVKALGQET